MNNLESSSEMLPDAPSGLWVVTTPVEVVFLDFDSSHSLRLIRIADQDRVRNIWRDLARGWVPLTEALSSGGRGPLEIGLPLHLVLADGSAETTTGVVKTISPAREHLLGAVVDRLSRAGRQRILVSEGWWPLVAETDRRLAEIHPGYEVREVSESLGLMRYRVAPAVRDRGGAEAMKAIVDEARERSSETCEACGRPGARQPLGALRTVCPDHTGRL